jgi:DNA-binding NarL/FixJ family response regulator
VANTLFASSLVRSAAAEFPVHPANLLDHPTSARVLAAYGRRDRELAQTWQRPAPAAQPECAADVATRLAEHIGDENLTDREMQILKLIQSGFRNKQIADQLLVAESTVNFHIKNIVDKLHARDRTHAVMIALRRGLVSM